MNCNLTIAQQETVDLFFTSINSMAAVGQQTDYDKCFVYEALKRGAQVLAHQLTIEALIVNKLAKRYTPSQKDLECGVGYIELPQDFARFISIRLPEWHFTSTRLRDHEGTSRNVGRYRLSIFQDNATPESFISTRTIGTYEGAVIGFTPVTSTTASAITPDFWYVPLTPPELLPEVLKSLCVWWAASDVFSASGDFDLGQAAKAKFLEVANLYKIGLINEQDVLPTSLPHTP